jgi:hypothetical protein
MPFIMRTTLGCMSQNKGANGLRGTEPHKMFFESFHGPQPDSASRDLDYLHANWLAAQWTRLIQGLSRPRP